MARSKMIVLYTLFAAISIGANLGAQKLYLLGAPPFYIVPLSVFVGTAIGLAVKFILDKIWIFKYEHRDLAHGLRSFILYSVMGIGTTVVFWSTEFGAGLLFGTEAARLTGGAIGLVLGYAVKYQLDKQFTFA